MAQKPKVSKRMSDKDFGEVTGETLKEDRDLLEPLAKVWSDTRGIVSRRTPLERPRAWAGQIPEGSGWAPSGPPWK